MIWRILLAALAILLGCQSLAALAGEERHALLIGNARYSEKVGPLKNPHNDVALIAASLRRIGFVVTVIKDATYRSLDVEIKRHAIKLRQAGDGGIGFFYYSGHGIANPETSANYLIPIDVRTIADEDIWLYAFEQQTVVDKLSSIARNATHFVVFDACRDELAVQETRTKSIGAAKGFVPIASRSGLLIAYATAPGKTASDEGLEGGPYATVLAEELIKPGVEAVNMFRRVQLRVRAKIKQDPWLSFPALPEIFLAGRKPETLPESDPKTAASALANGGNKPVSASVPMSDAAKAWLITQHSDNTTILEAFAKEFPDSIFAKFALVRIKELDPRNSIANGHLIPSPKSETVVAVQKELKRLNCYAGAIDSDWGPQSRLAMERFNQRAKTSFAAKSPSQAALKTLRATEKSVCPARPPGPAKSNQGASKERRRRPNPSRYSFRIWPPYNLGARRRSLQTKYGLLICTAGSRRAGTGRRCWWN